MQSDEGIRFFDPTTTSGELFVWDDGVHIVDEVKKIPGGLQYILACGQKFTFGLPIEDGNMPLEARLELPKEPMCKNCLP